MSVLEDYQTTLDQRFACCICLCPKLNMVYGQCQHRACDDCLYENNERRICMEKCPICGMNNSFPRSKPIIPLQTIDIQKYIGVQECPNGCKAQIWYWEADEHSKVCPSIHKTPSKQTGKVRSRHRSHVNDRGSVTTLSRSPNTSSDKRVTRSVSRSRRPQRQSRLSLLS
ncbi:hypothetical protein ACF0H5_003582 [Mactra antiquata]